MGGAEETGGAPDSAGCRKLICSGDWSDRPGSADYRRALLGDVLVERLVWSDQAQAYLPVHGPVAGPGFVWFRFWLPRQEQVVEKYFDAQGVALGMQVDLCSQFVMDGERWQTEDLWLDLRIEPSGRVILSNEAAFEAATAAGCLSDEEIRRAEAKIRQLTASIAAGLFPPPLVRNWQIDIKRIQERLAL